MTCDIFPLYTQNTSTFHSFLFISGKGYCYDEQELPIVHIGNCDTTSPCTECMGDCDSDADCESGLYCFERKGLEKIPGCHSGGISGKECIVFVNSQTTQLVLS